MPTRSTPRSAAAKGGGRFARSQPHRPATRRSTPSARLAARRRPAPRSKSDKALSGLAGLLPGSVLGRAAKPAPGGGGKGRKAGFALLAGAAGLALKNRDKLPGPLGRSRGEEPLPEPVSPTTATPPAPATPVATAPAPPV